MLYFVSTPIGNLKDISFRAIEVLKEVDVIACEDTRHSLTLFNAYEIKKPLIAYHKFNEIASCDGIVKLLKEGKNVAVVSDAGTPLISDPGSILCKRLIDENLPFTVIPGACAFIPALILSGMDTKRFYFFGFLPEKNSDAVKELESVKGMQCPVIFYCAPHDVDKVIPTVYKVFGERKAVAVKEITKLHEQATPFNLSEGFSGEKKGEFVIVVEGFSGKTEYPEDIEEHLKIYLDKGLDKKEAIKAVAKDRGVNKNEIYKKFFND